MMHAACTTFLCNNEVEVVCSCVHEKKSTHAHIPGMHENIHKKVHAHTRTHARTHARMPAHTHARTHACTHTHTHYKYPQFIHRMTSLWPFTTILATYQALTRTWHQFTNYTSFPKMVSTPSIGSMPKSGIPLKVGNHVPRASEHVYWTRQHNQGQGLYVACIYHTLSSNICGCLQFALTVHNTFIQEENHHNKTV